MTEFEKGMLVQHVSLGLGKVVGLEEKAVHVYFVGRDSRYAAKLRLPDAGGMLSPAEPSAKALLGGVSSFALDPHSGRYALAETWISREDAVARFLETYPGGFADPLYTGEGRGRLGRGSRLRRGHLAWVETLGGGEGERLLAEGAIGKLVDAALKIEKTAAASTSGADRASLAEGLADPEAAGAFFTALFAFLATPAPEAAAFDALAAAVARFPGGAGPAGWPLLTLLPFLAQPGQHLLLRPKLTSQAAHRLGFELRFAAAPNWTTYATLLRSGDQLLAWLKPLGASDQIDVEAFTSVVTLRAADHATVPRVQA